MRNSQQVRSARLSCCRCCSCVKWNGDNNQMLSRSGNNRLGVRTSGALNSDIKVSKAWIHANILLDENHRVWHLTSRCGILCRQRDLHCSCGASDKHPIKVARRICRRSGWDIKTHLSRDIHSCVACECSKICERSRS